MNKTEFKEFFQNYSKNVDNADVSNFWKLSDDLILQIIKDNIPVTEDMTLLDAGGGTGRWVKKLSDIYPGNFIIYDLSEDMLEQAYSNIKNAGIENRVEIIQ
ncbi:MAG: methyltransferase domain-containing protein [Patescibacteria group bacterium]|nr:methyltransferase domain-containing protein [Patescibacteria group bacterium]